MNSTVFKNQTSSFGITCTDSIPGFSLQLSVIALDFIVLPIQIWVLWLGSGNFRIRGRLAASEIFTMNLSALEVFVMVLYCIIVVTDHIDSEYTMFIAMLFNGSYLVGRPLMNSLICVERYIAVAHPAMYRNPAFVKHRYISAGLVWMLSLAYGGLSVYSPDTQIEVFACSLSISLLVITTCSLGVLKILLRPSPGETQKEGMHHQKKRAFVIITGILVCISVPYGLDVFVLAMKVYIPKDTICVLLGTISCLIQVCSLIQPSLYLSKLGKFSCIKKGSH